MEQARKGVLNVILTPTLPENPLATARRELIKSGYEVFQPNLGLPRLCITVKMLLSRGNVIDGIL